MKAICKFQSPFRAMVIVIITLNLFISCGWMSGSITRIEFAVPEIPALYPKTESQKIFAAVEEDNAGFSVVDLSSDSSHLIIGATLHDSAMAFGEDPGVAFVYSKTGSSWAHRLTLSASDESTQFFFGTGVALSSDGNMALVGASSRSAAFGNQGSVYFFTMSGSSSVQQTIIDASDPEAAAAFGGSVRGTPDFSTAAIAAVGDDASGAINSNRGAVYIFTRSGITWSQQAKLVASDQEDLAYFGTSIDLSSDGNTLAIGANLDDANGGVGTNRGAIYIFTRSGSTWSQETKIVAPDEEDLAEFGLSIALSSDGKTVVIGSWKDDANGSTGDNRGAAYVFTKSGAAWNFTKKLVASDEENSAQFGYSVDISGEGRTIVVGAITDDAQGATNANRGAAYSFTLDNGVWVEKIKLIASDPSSIAEFGNAVKVSSDGGKCYINAQNHPGQVPGSQRGALYEFTQ